MERNLTEDEIINPQGDDKDNETALSADNEGDISPRNVSNGEEIDAPEAIMVRSAVSRPRTRIPASRSRTRPSALVSPSGRNPLYSEARSSWRKWICNY